MAPLPICLLTDYGLSDEFVGVLHRVLAANAPLCPIIDLTHGIARHDVRAGALALWRSVPYLAPAVVLAVVDPGVGTGRRPIALEVADAGSTLLMVGPDNGLLTPAALRAGTIGRAVVLDDGSWHLGASTASGATFAGRDVFAPVAARLASGTDLGAVGSRLDPAGIAGGAVHTAEPDGGGRIAATALWVDHFGNVELDVGTAGLPPPGTQVRLGVGRVVVDAVVAVAYADLGEQPGLVADSAGLVALCLDRADAAQRFGLRAGDRVVIDPSIAGAAGTLGR